MHRAVTMTDVPERYVPSGEYGWESTDPIPDGLTERTSDTHCGGIGVGDAIGSGVGAGGGVGATVGVGGGGGVTVGVGVGIGVEVGLGSGVGTGVGAGALVGAGVTVGMGDGSTIGVSVAGADDGTTGASSSGVGVLVASDGGSTNAARTPSFTVCPSSLASRDAAICARAARESTAKAEMIVHRIVPRTFGSCGKP